MSRRSKSKDASKRMTSKEFSEYPDPELMEEPGQSNHTTTGKKPFSPIAEVEEGETESNQSNTSRHQTAVSSRTTMSPSHSSVSPVSHSSSSGHSSPHSPPTNHTHTVPPPPHHSVRPHPPASSASSLGKSRTFPIQKTGSSSHTSRVYATHGASHSSKGPTHHGGRGHVISSAHHMPQDPRPVVEAGHVKSYEVHHLPYSVHLPSQHPQSPYQWVPRVGGVGTQLSDKGSHVSNLYPPDPSASSSKQYETGTSGGHLPGDVALVNTRVVPSKMFPTHIVTDNHIEVVDHSEVIHDPGERGSPSGESNPSSTPNSTLGKSTHRSTLDPLQSSASESKLTQAMMALGHLDSRDPVEGKDELQISVSDTTLVKTSRGKQSSPESKTNVVSPTGSALYSVPTAKHNHPHNDMTSSIDHMTSHNQSQRATYKPLRVSAGHGADTGATISNESVAQSLRNSVRLAQFNQNGNHSEGVTQSDKQEVTNAKEMDQDLKGTKTDATLVGVASNINPALPSHMTNSGDKKGAGSPSSSMEELSNINEEETDSGPREVPHPLLKLDPTKSKTHLSGSSGHHHSHPPQYPPPPHPLTSHHHTGHTDPPPYGPAHQFSSLSQPLPQGMLTSQSSSQASNYSYETHHGSTVPPTRADPAHNHSTGYGRASMSHEGGPHHHVSPPLHTSQSYEGHPPTPKYVVPPLSQQHQSLGYRVSHDSYVGSHDHHPGSHEHHMTGHHRGPPPGMQYLQQRGDQFNSHHVMHYPDHPVHFTKANISHAHEAAATGDLRTLHRMLTNHEIDAFGFTENHFSLAHEAAFHARLLVLQFLITEGGLSLNGLQTPDNSFTTPTMLAIQAGSVDCLQWLVDEGKVPFQVRDTGGETLMHHAAFHGQANCLDWLMNTVKKRSEQNDIKEILDESGVTPAHFAAQGGHLECLQLLIDYGYSVVHADRENQKPLDWADAMGQSICVRYLMMYETCWALSAELTHLAEQMAITQKQNDQLREAFSLQEKEYDATISKLRQSHDERLTKMREQHVDLMASILNMKDHDSVSITGGVASGTSTKKNQPPVRKAPTEPPPNAQRRLTRPPIPPDANKKRSGRGGVTNYETTKDRGHESNEQSRDKEDEHEGIDYRTATPQEVLENKMTHVARRMNASREARKRQGGIIPRTFSPLTPIIQRMYSKHDEAESKGERSSRSQRHSESHTERRSAPKVKFSQTVTEFPDYSYPAGPDNNSKLSPHGGITSPGHSPSQPPTEHAHQNARPRSEGDTPKVNGDTSEHGSRKSSEK